MNRLLPEFFKRLDNRPDHLFYAEPRCVAHIDDEAIKVTEELYTTLLPEGGSILDLMASYRSHLPPKVGPVTGLGLNLTELSRNPQVDESLIQDLNCNAKLPFAEARFGGAVCTVSVQYITRPDELFPELARVLKPGAPFVVTFSNRMFPTKAILAWRASDDAAHIRLVKSYFAQAPDFGPVAVHCHAPAEGDPLYAVWAFKRGGTYSRASLN